MKRMELRSFSSSASFNCFFCAAICGQFKKEHPLPGNFLHKFGKFSLFASWPKSHKYLCWLCLKDFIRNSSMFFFSPIFNQKICCCRKDSACWRDRTMILRQNTLCCARQTKEKTNNVQNGAI